MQRKLDEGMKSSKNQTDGERQISHRQKLSFDASKNGGVSLSLLSSAGGQTPVAGPLASDDSP
jgi:hypothetical protein